MSSAKAKRGVYFSPRRPAACPDPLPCPFCGGCDISAVASPELWRRMKRYVFRVFCRGCTANIEHLQIGGYEIDKDAGLRSAVEGWNRRV